MNHKTMKNIDRVASLLDAKKRLDDAHRMVWGLSEMLKEARRLYNTMSGATMKQRTKWKLCNRMSILEDAIEDARKQARVHREAMRKKLART